MSAPEIRIDQLTGLRSVLAPGRAERPDAFVRAAAPPRADSECPFCDGHESETPPEVWAERPGDGGADTPGWTARAVPNLYPVLSGAGAAADVNARGESGLASADDPLGRTSRGAPADPFASTPASGAHEVIVNAPEHATTLAGLSPERFAGAVDAWRQRIRAHAAESAYCHLIVNEGSEAGASLVHTHAQLYALEFVPVTVARERERFTAYNERTAGGHLLEDVGAEEVRRGDRLVAVDDDALLVCPWASRSPFELRVIPRRPARSFEDDDSGTEMIRTAITALGELLEAPPLNLWVRTAPSDASEFHWHVDILPRLTIRAGFELGTGVEVNTYPPERAAEDLRGVI